MKVQRVNIVVHKDFFNKWFEPKRKSLEKQLGIRVSQPNFTKYMIDHKVEIKMPKHKGLPKAFRRK